MNRLEKNSQGYKLRICILIDDYLPFSIKVAAKMMHELAVELKTKRGHAVTVVTPQQILKII